MPLCEIPFSGSVSSPLPILSSNAFPQSGNHRYNRRPPPRHRRSVLERTHHTSLQQPHRAPHQRGVPPNPRAGHEFPPFNTNLFKSTSVEKTKTNLTVKYQAGAEPPWHTFHGSLSSHKADNTGTIHIGDGSIRLEYIGVATERTPEVQPRVPSIGIGIHPKYFTPDLKSVDPNESILRFEPYRRELYPQRWPAARFVFSCTSLTNFVTRRFDAFDARTHYPFSTRNYKQGPFRNTIRFDTPLRLWHQTPIELLVTLAMGPAQIYPMPVAEGAELIFPGGALKLLAIAEGRLEIQHQFDPLAPTTPPNKVTLAKAESSVGEPAYLSLIFYAWPNEGLLPWEIEFIDDTGNVQSAGYNAGSGPILVKAIHCSSLDNLKRIQVRRYPALHTLSFTIPELPGLPEQNRNLQNLFDVHVPYLEMQSPLFLKLHLADLVQMQVRNTSLNPKVYRDPSFQKTRTNTTARALFDELAASLPEHHTLIADPDRNEIHARRSVLAGPVAFLKSLFRIK